MKNPETHCKKNNKCLRVYLTLSHGAVYQPWCSRLFFCWPFCESLSFGSVVPSLLPLAANRLRFFFFCFPALCACAWALGVGRIKLDLRAFVRPGNGNELPHQDILHRH